VVARRGGDVARPRRPYEGKALAKQEAVAGMRDRGRIVAGRRFVDLTEDADIAALLTS
jgi:hypothetical protein